MENPLIYLASLPKTTPLDELYPKIRNDEVHACTSEKTRREKYFVWKLLERAVNEVFSRPIEDFTFFRSESGKWKCDRFEFSLAHTEGALCVALSDFPVGADIEPVPAAPRERALIKILSEREKAEYVALNEGEKAEYFARKWTERESVFKRLDLPAFFPALPLLFEGSAYTQIVSLGEKRYALSVSNESKTPPKLVIVR